jgi:hypothetical protein
VYPVWIENPALDVELTRPFTLRNIAARKTYLKRRERTAGDFGHCSSVQTLAIPGRRNPDQKTV